MTPLQRRDMDDHLELIKRLDPLDVRTHTPWERHVAMARIIGAFIAIWAACALWVGCGQ
jgi:hypothetical protein